MTNIMILILKINYLLYVYRGKKLQNLKKKIIFKSKKNEAQIKKRN